MQKVPVVDLSIEKRVMEFYLKNIKDGYITPDFCLELISRASEAEAIVELLEVENENLRTELAQLQQKLNSLQGVALVN